MKKIEKKNKNVVLKEDKPRHVRIGGEILFYASKAPYIVSGFSIAGAVEYDKEDDTLRCHECGGWIKHLGVHARLHNLTARQYKIKHGLHSSASLVNEKCRTNLIVRARRSFEEKLTIRQSFFKNWGSRYGKRKPSVFFKGRGRPEGKNKNVLCLPQLKEKIIALAKILGRTPRAIDLARVGMNHRTVAKTFGSLERAMKLCNLIPNRRFGTGGALVYDYNKAALVALLKDFRKAHGRFPSTSDANRKLIPNRHIFVRRFGSWPAALKAAGCRGWDFDKKFTKFLTDEELLQRLSKFCEVEGRVPTLAASDEDLLNKYGITDSIFRRRFGSLRSALVQIGRKKEGGRWYGKISPSCFVRNDKRAAQVHSLIAEGYTHSEISKKLGLAKSVISYYTSSRFKAIKK